MIKKIQSILMRYHFKRWAYYHKKVMNSPWKINIDRLHSLSSYDMTSMYPSMWVGDLGITLDMSDLVEETSE